MIGRNDRGKLIAKTLELQILLDDFFEICKTENEVEWLHETLSSALEVSYEDKLKQIEDGE